MISKVRSALLLKQAVSQNLGEACDEQLIDKKKPGRNDELVRIGQALLQGNFGS